MAFDPKCLELAAAFLPTNMPAGSTLRERLAQHIQDSVEEWLTSERDGLRAQLTKPSQTH